MSTLPRGITFIWPKQNAPHFSARLANSFCLHACICGIIKKFKSDWAKIACSLIAGRDKGILSKLEATPRTLYPLVVQLVKAIPFPDYSHNMRQKGESYHCPAPATNPGDSKSLKWALSPLNLSSIVIPFEKMGGKRTSWYQINLLYQ